MYRRGHIVRGIPTLVMVISAAATCSGCDSRAEEWTAWVYPNASDLSLSISMNGFATFEQCQEAAIGKLRSFDEPDAGDYDCGYMCRWDARFETNVCKETRK